MTFSRTLAVLLSAAVLLATLPHVALGSSTPLSADCQDELNQLWSNYTNPAYTISGCDTDCLNECKDIIETAMYVTNLKSCPLQDDITRCFGYYAGQWEDYVSECAIFTVDQSSLPAGSAAEAGSEAGSSPAPPTTDTTTTTTTESPSPPPASNSEAGADTTAAGRRRMLATEAEAGAPVTTGSGVCFPNFKSTEEFTMYIEGTYFSLAYNPPSDTVGIILSTFFWVGLGALGYHLRK